MQTLERVQQTQFSSNCERILQWSTTNEWNFSFSLLPLVDSVVVESGRWNGRKTHSKGLKLGLKPADPVSCCPWPTLLTRVPHLHRITCKRWVYAIVRMLICSRYHLLLFGFSCCSSFWFPICFDSSSSTTPFQNLPSMPLSYCEFSYGQEQLIADFLCNQSFTYFCFIYFFI